MKKNTLLLCSMLLNIACTLNAQITNQNLQTNNTSFENKTIKIKDNTNHVNLNKSIKNYSPTAAQTVTYANGIIEEIIGETYYDLQTNNSVQNRLFVHEDNTISAVWTTSPDPQGNSSFFPDRGTGYNYFDGTSWFPKITNKIEDRLLRTGWPSISGINNGEIIASHGIGNENSNVDGKTNILKNTAKGVNNWSNNTIPDTTYANMWPRMMVGGTDGNTVHVISNTYNSNENEYITYSRSTDGATTWDITDSILPGIGPDYYMRFSADAYAMDVRGETVAFVVGDSWTDVVLMKSNDNGSTWTKTVIHEHPIPMFDDNIVVDNPIQNSDQNFSISLDNNGDAHVFFGLMNYSNNEIEDSSFEYTFTTQGLIYWNEITQTPTLIAQVIDENENSVIDIQSNHIAKYENSLTSLPSSAVANNGDIYLTYSGVIEYMYPIQEELGSSGDENYLQHYRHQYIMRSQDGGETWSDPYDLMAEITESENADPLQEGVFGCIGNKIDDYIHLTYQRDHLPGLNIRGDEDPITNNKIVYLKIPVDNFADLESLSTNELISNKNNNLFTIYPNPSDNLLNITINKLDENTTISILNVLGEKITSQEMQSIDTQISTETLKSGMYFISIETPSNKMTKSFIKK